MNKIYLHREDLEQMIKFLDAFKSDQLEITSESTSGIGAIITAKITEINLNGMEVNVEKVISNENHW